MTSLAFILGDVPMVLATGAGAEMRQSLGTAVFSGMVGETCSRQIEPFGAGIFQQGSRDRDKESSMKAFTSGSLSHLAAFRQPAANASFSSQNQRLPSP
jgi:hypothetical protein